MARLITILSLLFTSSIVNAVLHPDLSSLLIDDDDDDTPLPLVIWHGLGDNYAADGLAEVGQIAEETNPGTFVYNVRIDEDPSADRSATFFGNLTLQIEKVCADLAKHPILSTAPAIDALGFSQGGQFLRAYVERCNSPPVRSLVTFGSQHNGISEFQNCGTTDWLCKAAEGLLRGSTWSSFVQSRLVPAQYFRDPNQYEQYLENSNFLADINNERLLKNRAYKRNMEKLERFVMYIFEDDTTVIPKESGWFAEVNGTEITPLKERDIYKEDWIGLKTLDKKGALHFKTTEGGHMALSDKLLGSVFKENYGPMKKSTKVFDIPSPQEVRPNLPLDALAEYEKQLERLVEQNKLRLELARQEQDVVDGVVSWPEAAGYIVEDKKLDAEAATLAQNADYEKQLELLEQAKQKELMEQAQNFAFRVQREHGPKKDEM